ncbi:MAG: component of SufBCD complex [Rhodobacter sp.]|nr:component of SufBCD complex [Rhodobacter sp.]
MNWYDTVFELIDMRSFSNLWYWIALAVVWSTMSHWVLGVPYDMVQRARRVGGQTQADLEDLVRINVNRLLFIGRVSGLWILAITCAVLTGLLMLGFWYWVEFAQALFLLLFPLAIVGLVSLATARRIEAGEGAGDALYRRLRWHRLYVQMIGLVAIFVTAMWGMYQNMTVGALGG